MKHITILAVLIAAAALAQGPLAPPGAPAPTMKTLDEIHSKVADVGERRTPISVLPYLINQPGSYYLTSNLSPDVSGNGITITASAVTLDLNGFSLSGFGSAQPGITLSTAADVRIHNGSIGGWATGVQVSTGIRCILEKLNIAVCSATGINQTGGNGVQVRDCTVSLCNVGIRIGTDGVVTGNVVVDSTNAGIEVAGNFVEVRGNICQRNGSGVVLIGTSSNVDGNSFKQNTLGFHGIAGCAPGCVRRNIFRGNTTNYSAAFISLDVAPFEPATTSTNPHANISY